MGGYELNLYAYSGILNAAGFAFIGARVFLNNPRALLNRVFAILVCSAFLWSFPYIFWAASTTGESAMLWLRILNAMAAFIAPGAFAFSLVLIGLFQKKKKLISWLFVLFAPFAFQFLFTDLLLKDAIHNHWIFFTPVRGPFLSAYLTLWFATLGYSIYLLVRHYWEDRSGRQPILLYAVALAIGIVGGGSNYIMWYAKVPPFGNAFVFLFVVIVMIAITRYNFMNIRTIAAEVISYISWYFILMRFFLAEGPKNRIIEGIFLILSILFGIFLIKSVRNEVRQKEQLADLNENLEAKVAEQTKEIRRAYEVEKKARHELEELDKAKTDFILTTQHHLRTPLTVVKGVANMFSHKENGYALTETDTAFLKKLDSGANKLAKLINDFLDISQMEVGKSILRKSDTSPHALIDQCITELSDEIGKKQLRIERATSDEAEQLLLSIDKEKIQAAFANLFDNAVKYTSAEGRITIKEDITTHPIEKKKQYELKIIDTGIGMTKEEQEKVFARLFERGARAREMNATGQGIGLVVTKRIIEAHGGVIELSSEGRDSGTTALVTLPIG
jgi:signal transduction histidine kinase